MDEVKTAVAYPVSKNTAAWNTDETAEMTKIWTGSVDVETGLKDLAAKMNADLAKE